MLTSLAIALAVATAADDGLRQPTRLTVGASDQLLGQLSPDGKWLYYVSNAEATSDIYVQDVAEGRRHRLFDEGADATWPRVSPDGTKLLYISFQSQATGQLCVRDLPKGEGRRCLETTAGAIQAEWVTPSRIIAVGRDSIQSDFRALDVSLGRSLSAKPLLNVDLTSPSVSPDGRWLVYVPVERDVREVGPGFAAHTSHRLEAVRLDQPSAARQPITIDLPGLTAQPVFSRDGKFLYVVQFLADSNGDGVVDASDHGILFRVPFDTAADDAPARASTAFAEQLTDSSWNCQYPAPAANRLVATCSQNDNLDVYGLPLDGSIPEGWNKDRIHLELELSGRRVEQLLLYRRVLGEPAPPATERLRLIRLVKLHLQHQEFDAARFYAQKEATIKDPTTKGLGRRLLAWVDHRQKLAERERGSEVGTFADDERQRLAKLAPKEGDSAGAIALGHVIASEIHDGLGEISEARRELEAVVIDAHTPHSVVEMYHERADALYRALDERDALADVCRRLASLPSLAPDLQLRYARDLVHALTRGLPTDEAVAALKKEQAATPADSERAFALELGQALLLIRDDKSPGARDALVALYGKQTRVDRQRAIMLDAIARATLFDADRVVEALAQHYVEDVKPGTSERVRAERLYAGVMMGRAFRHRLQNRLPQAREEFEKVVHHTGSLEALVASLDLRLRAGEASEAIAADLEKSSGYPKPLLHFARAFLLARQLENLDGDAHAKAVQDASDQLKASWVDLQNHVMSRAVAGALRNEAYLETADLTQAERAATQYGVGLKLAKADPREYAMFLGQLGLLHTAVGNYRIALGYFEDRAKLPKVDNSAGLAIQLAHARALLHVNREVDAAATAEEALKILERNPKLERYKPLVLDRAALCNLAAGLFPRALALYDQEIPELEKLPGPAGARNRLVARLAHAAAALGADKPDVALADLAVVGPELDRPDVQATLTWPHATPAQVLDTYHLIASGLEANALKRLGRTQEAARALERRRDLFARRLKDSDRDEDLRAVALVESRLADNAVDSGDSAAAGHWAAQALGHADELAHRTGTPIAVEQADTLWLEAEVAAFRLASLNSESRDRLTKALDAMPHDDPSWRRYRRWYEIYLVLTQTP